MLEVCVDSLESAINSIHGGADELEVCSSLAEGGLTPSVGLVKEIVLMAANVSNKIPINKTCVDCNCKNLTKIPKVNVMIRCRPGLDFCYTEHEMQTMLADMHMFKEFRIDSFVFGALTNKQEICEVNCKKVVEQAFHYPVSFHRAFDLTKDPDAAMKKIIELGFGRLLTSGQRASVDDPEAFELIKHLTKSYGDKITIVPGAGINDNNAKMFIDAGCKFVHSSCKTKKFFPKIENNLSMGTTERDYYYVADENIVKELKDVIKK